MIPEVWNGRNIADFIDPEIEAKLEALEREEEERINSGYYDFDLASDDEELDEIRSLARQIREKKGIMKFEQRMKQTNKPKMPRVIAKKVSALSCDLAITFLEMMKTYYLTKTFTDHHDLSVLLLRLFHSLVATLIIVYHLLISQPVCLTERTKPLKITNGTARSRR